MPKGDYLITLTSYLWQAGALGPLTCLSKICHSLTLFHLSFQLYPFSPGIFPFNSLNNTPLLGPYQMMVSLLQWRCFAQPHLEPLYGSRLHFGPLTKSDKSNPGSFTAVTCKDKLLRY